jgi:hypothetical protein
VGELEQTIVDHDDTEVAYRLGVEAYERAAAHRATPNPTLARLFERMARLQADLGEIEARDLEEIAARDSPPPV